MLLLLIILMQTTNLNNMSTPETIRDINAAAMRGGVSLALFGILTLFFFKCSFTIPFCSTLFGVMLLGTPVLATVLTIRHRAAVAGSSGSYGFFQGFLYALFTGFYASIWVAVTIYIYLQYFDHGKIFAAYAAQLETPPVQAYLTETGMAAQLNEISGGRGAQGLAEMLQEVGAATYSALSLYMSFIFGPLISAIIGLICRRR